MLQQITLRWRFIVAVVTPLVLMPMNFIEETETIGYPDKLRPTMKWKTAYVMSVMAVYWIVEVIPTAGKFYLYIVNYNLTSLFLLT